MMTSDYLYKHYMDNNKKIVVSTLYGKEHEISLSNDGQYFYSLSGLGKNNFLYLKWFDGIVELIKNNDGVIKKGSARNSFVGEGKCTSNTLCYYVATQCYGVNEGESCYDPIFIISAILEEAGICKNTRGYLKINK